MAKQKTAVAKKVKHKTSNPVRCGDCEHYSRRKKEGFEGKCKTLGVNKNVSAPSCFSPDAKKLVSKRIPVQQLGDLVKDMSPSQLRLVSQLMKEASRIKEAAPSFRFGQEVYVSLGRDFLTHYFKGFILTVRDGYAHISSQLKQKSKNLTYISLPIDFVLTKDAFREKAELLIEKGKIYEDKLDLHYWRSISLPERMDEKGRVHIDVEDEEMQRFLDSIDAPTIDKAPKEMEEVKVKKGKKKVTVLREKKSKKRVPKLNEAYNSEGYIIKLS